MAETVKTNSQPSTSYSTPRQCMELSATVSMPETTSGVVGTGSTEIWRRSTSRMDVHTSSSDYWPFTANICRWAVSDSHFRPNRKWKYGRNHIIQLATIDFLFDPNTMYGSIDHRLDATTTSGFGGTGSTEISSGSTSKMAVSPDRLSTVYSEFLPKKQHPRAISGQTGSGNMAETAHMNSQPSTSYSTSLWSLFRRCHF